MLTNGKTSDYICDNYASANVLEKKARSILYFLHNILTMHFIDIHLCVEIQI